MRITVAPAGTLTLLAACATEQVTVAPSVPAALAVPADQVLAKQDVADRGDQTQGHQGHEYADAGRVGARVRGSFGGVALKIRVVLAVLVDRVAELGQA